MTSTDPTDPLTSSFYGCALIGMAQFGRLWDPHSMTSQVISTSIVDGNIVHGFKTVMD